MSLKAIGCLTPKTQPFPISQTVKEGRICSFETIPSVLSLGFIFISALVMQVCVLGNRREKALAGFSSNIFNMSMDALSPLRAIP